MNTIDLQDKSRVALVVGANGIVGSNMLNHLSEKTNWNLFGVSRAPMGSGSRASWVGTDLLDTATCLPVLESLGRIDYIFFTALAVRKTNDEQVEPNLTMLRNAVTPFLNPVKKLRHVCMVHGTKWYGSHLGPYRTPARESDSRHQGANFYYDQHDWLSAAQQGQSWGYSTIRPHFINGFNVGNSNNMMAAIGAYAAVQRSQGKPLDFPGTPAAYESLTMVSDVSIVNSSMLWSATSPQCANQDFNIHNGDYFRWKNVWPLLAEAFKMPCGKVVPTKLSEYMPLQSENWNRIVTEFKLKPTSLDRLVSWTWADFFFRGEWDDMSSMLKARKFGFDQFLDTQEELVSSVETYRAQKILP